MNDHIDPAIVEKAAKAMADNWNPERDPILTAMFRDYAQTALEAAAPLIAAKALEDARKALRSLADEWEQRAETPCPDHRPVQHRDAKEPWCKLCGLNASGEAPRGGVRANWGEVQP